MGTRKVRLSAEERELLQSVEAGEWQSSSKHPASYYQELAGNTFKKDARVNIRISGNDIVAVKARAAQEGLPYQTMMASIIHKFVSGRLVERA